MSTFLNHFAIPFVSLSEGTHLYDFEINDLFFENIEFSEIKQGFLHAKIELEKKANMLALSFNIKGSIMVNCDICLNSFALPVEVNNIIYVKFGSTYTELSVDIITIPHESSEINVAQYMYEFIYLALPIKKAHPLDREGNSTCDEKMIKILESLQPKNSTNQTWDVLKSLKKK